MKYITLYVFVILSLIGCQKGHSPQFDITGFEGHYNDFVQEAALRGIDGTTDDLIIQLQDNLITQGDDGLCIFGGDHTPTITFDTTYWNSISYQSQEVIFFHEMGHCRFRFVHFNLLLSNGAPESIMYLHADAFNQGIDNIYYDNNRSSYMDQFFNLPQGQL